MGERRMERTKEKKNKREKRTKGKKRKKLKSTIPFSSHQKVSNLMNAGGAHSEYI